MSLRADLAGLEAECSEELRRSVYDNYRPFIDASQVAAVTGVGVRVSANSSGEPPLGARHHCPFLNASQVPASPRPALCLHDSTTKSVSPNMHRSTCGNYRPFTDALGVCLTRNPLCFYQMLLSLAVCL